MREALLRWADAFLCAALLLLLEALVVAAIHWNQIAGGYELGRVLHSVLPIGVVAAAVVALGGWALLASVQHIEGIKPRLWLSSLSGLWALGVAFGVSTGRHLQGARRPVFVVVVTAAAVTAGWFLAPKLSGLIRRLQERGSYALLGALAVVIVALELANTWILPRLYPAFHWGLGLLTLWVAALLSYGWSPERWLRLRAGMAAVLASLCLLASYGAPERLSLYDNIRFIYLERAPLLANALRLGALVSPPVTLDEAEAFKPYRSRHRASDWSGRDVLLVTVDALRADHLGAYGYKRATSPFFDELARGGVLFEQAYTATPHTSYAITSLMTGKYLRPLLRQGVADDSETLAQVLRRYEYRTAAFYPPAAFFVDRQRFATFEKSGLGFEYRKTQFSSAPERLEEVRHYLSSLAPDRHLLMWVHLFEPHEPYIAHPGHDFGERSIDRYDSEIAATDAALRQLVKAVRVARPRCVVIVSADHGEEFGDHGGRYHGTTVYDEQVRVPLLVHAPGLLPSRRVSAPVGLVDVFPTVLAAMGIPISPRVRGNDLGPHLVGRGDEQGFAFAETDDQTLLARGTLRLLCARRIGACRLFDTKVDAAQTQDVSAKHVHAFVDMKRQLAGFVASLGRFEGAGNGWPQALRRGIAGDTEAAMDVAALLDDANVRVRRKAAAVLFELRSLDVAPQLRRALARDEDVTVRRWCALALTRLGQGAPLSFDLLAGDGRGEAELLRWWLAAYPEDPSEARETIDFSRGKELAAAFGTIKSRAAVGPLTWGLRDLRLRVFVAEGLRRIGDSAARPALGKALAAERYFDARNSIARALVSLGGGGELRQPLVRFMGVPDPISEGLLLAMKAGVLGFVGGPRKRELVRLRKFATSGVTVGLTVPEGGNGRGLRVLVRVRSRGQGGQVRFGLPVGRPSADDRTEPVPKQVPRLDNKLTTTLKLSAREGLQELHATLPAAVSALVSPGSFAEFVIYATQNVEVVACAVVPLQDELAPLPAGPFAVPKSPPTAAPLTSRPLSPTVRR